MRATFRDEKLISVEGTPQEIAEFQDLLKMGPKVPEKKIPYQGTGPYTTTVFPSTYIGTLTGASTTTTFVPGISVGKLRTDND